LPEETRTDGPPVTSVQASTYVAYGNGAGEFFRAPPNATTGQAEGAGEAALLANYPFQDQLFPLAVADLNDDGAPDFVVSGDAGGMIGLSQRAGGNSAQVTYEVLSFEQPWSSARIADFNRDTVLDVMVASFGAELLFLRGAGGGAFSPFPVQLSGIAESLIVGDYDGDGLLDLAFAEKEVSTGPGQASLGFDSVSVVFGNAYGAPTDPVSMGYLRDVDWLAAGNFRGEAFSDGLDEIALGSGTWSDSANPSLAVLLGSGDRRMLAPYFFQHVDGQGNVVSHLPLSVALAELVPETAGVDLAALVTSAELSGACPWDPSAAPVTHEALWIAPVEGEAYMPAGQHGLVSLSGAALGDAGPVWWQHGLIAAIDLDAPVAGERSSDEIVVLAPRKEADGRLAGFVAVLERTDDATEWPFAWRDAQPTAQSFLRLRGRGCKPWVSEYTGERDGWGDDASGAPVTALLTDSKLEVVDLDRDGRKDLVALGFVAGSADPAELAGDPVVVVWWNDGSGTLDPARALVLPRVGSAAIRSFVALNADADRQLELALATDAGVLIADLAFDAGTGQPTGQLAAVSSGPQIDHSGGQLRSLVVGDFDADGVDDLAWGRTSDGAVLVALGVPVVR
jgi:hypothetical protein